MKKVRGSVASLGPKHRKYLERVLTPLKIRNITQPGRYGDGNGLYLIVDPSGAKRWVLRTVIKGRRCDLGLGGLSVVSLAEARQAATRLRGLARSGGDPLAERRMERRVVPTFEVATRQFHAEHSKTFRNDKHKAQWLRVLEDYAFPLFGAWAVDRIESGDVMKSLSPIWIEIPETARRLKQRIKAVFDWAKAAGYRTGDNPAEGLTKVLPKHNRKHKHYTALPYVELPRFIQDLRQAPSAEAVRLAFEFAILTAGRTAEVLKGTWSEIDMEARIWTRPGIRMKAKVEHRVPLSARCIEILTAAKATTDGGDYIFCGRTPSTHLSDMTFNMALRRMAWSGSACTPHGFRSTFRDWAAEQTQFQREVIESALAHTVENKTEASYFRSDLFDKRRDLMHQWDLFVTHGAGQPS